MPRLASTGLACLAVLVPAGCGGDNEQEPVQQAVRDFVQATNDGDPRACDELVTQRFLDEQSTQRGEAARTVCREQLKALRGVEVSIDRFVSTKVDGDEAEVVVALRSAGVRETRVIELAREDGGWRLDGGQERP